MSTTDDLRAIRDSISDGSPLPPEGAVGGLRKALLATLSVLIAERSSKPGDDLAVAGRNDDDRHPRGVCGDRATTVTSVTGALLVCALDPGHEGAHVDKAHLTMWGVYDGAGKGSTAARTGARSDAQPAEAPGEGRSEIGPQKGVQSLGDDLRDEASELCALANGKPYVVGVRPQDLIGIAQELDDYAARADALTTERDEAREAARVAAEMVKRTRMLATATGIEREPDGVSVDILPDPRPFQVAMLTTEMNAWRHKAIRRNVALARAERERDEARTEAESLRRAAQVTDASWREHIERAEKAEAAVARVRALLDRPLIPSALLRDALDGVDAGGDEDQEDRLASTVSAPEQCGCSCAACDPGLPSFLGRVPSRMPLCPDCGNKRCPKAADHRRWKCTGSNEPGQVGERVDPQCTCPTHRAAR